MSTVRAVFGTFGSQKRALVEEIHFGGMLRLPVDTEPDPQHSLWLMRSVETSDRPGLHLHTRNVHGIVCKDVDVHLILGVPVKGVEVALGESVQDKFVRAVRKLLHLNVISYPITIPEVREVLLKDYGSCMSYEQRASFKIAVVLFAVTMFLAPSWFSPDFANTEILKHLLDPGRIKDINWAGYFINCIKRDAARLKDELASGASSVVIHGCPSILQVHPWTSLKHFCNVLTVASESKRPLYSYCS
jgi:hypothetical protein